MCPFFYRGAQRHSVSRRASPRQIAIANQRICMRIWYAVASIQSGAKVPSASTARCQCKRMGFQIRYNGNTAWSFSPHDTWQNMRVDTIRFNEGTMHEGFHAMVFARNDIVTPTNNDIYQSTLPAGISVTPFTLAYAPFRSSAAAGLEKGTKYARGGFGMFIHPTSLLTDCRLLVRMNSADNFSQNFDGCIGKEFYVQYWPGYGNSEGAWQSAEIVFRLAVSSPGSTVPAGTPLFRATLFNFGFPNPVLFKLRMQRAKLPNQAAVLSTTFVSGDPISDAEDFSLLRPSTIWGDPVRTNDQHESISGFLDTHFPGDSRLRHAPWVAGMPGAAHPTTRNDNDQWKFMGVQFYCTGEESGTVLGDMSVSFYAAPNAMVPSNAIRPSGATGALPASIVSNAYLIKTDLATGDRIRIGADNNMSSASATSHTISFSVDPKDKMLLFQAFICFDNQTPGSQSSLAYQSKNGLLGTTAMNAFAISLFHANESTIQPLRTLVPSAASALLARSRSMVITSANVARTSTGGIPVGMLVSTINPHDRLVNDVLSRAPKPGFTRIHSAAVWVSNEPSVSFCRRQQETDCTRFMAALPIPDIPRTDTARYPGAWASRSVSQCPTGRMRHSDQSCIPLGRTGTDTASHARVVWNANAFSCFVPMIGTTPNSLSSSVDDTGLSWAICAMPSCPISAQIRNITTGACECPVGKTLVGSACLDPCPAGKSRVGAATECTCPAGQVDAGGSCSEPVDTTSAPDAQTSAPIAPDAQTSAPIAPSRPSSSSSSNGTVIALSVVGGIIVIAAIVGVFIMMKKKKDSAGGGGGGGASGE